MRSRPNHDQQIAADLVWCAKQDALDLVSAAEPVIERSCDRCRRFEPDQLNPPGGMGNCGDGLGFRFPGNGKQCHQFKESA